MLEIRTTLGVADAAAAAAAVCSAVAAIAPLRPPPLDLAPIREGLEAAAATMTNAMAVPPQDLGPLE